ncbi:MULTISPECIES: TetR/AcrR family transcriptional regulator [Methanobacterium]|uniref:TetR/AcrR family transcriptional regulator n=1 Tax=Methanobacterium veterum TaxID=408577 RepID=A0A9E5A058_9EURY|nr:MULTISPECIES: TetR/AcrR family transcriptional regulator [Methanobacterium]MCZ3365597.1 TetR/AcrR family transcriptional regulator [Methanobacterium veterum]MCZ3371060.1 TetR/AcrR family transcriptional regulator [Methanobacterium veterum]
MTIADRKEREKERRGQEIIDAAAKLFSKGYENVSMGDIAKESELARSTLYLYFKNKEDIYIAVAIRGSKILRKMFEEYYPKGKTGIEKIRLLIQAFCRFYREYPGYYHANWYSQIPWFNNEEFPEIEELKNIRTTSFKMVGNAIHEGIKDGTVRAGAAPLKSTLVVASLMQSVLDLSPAIEMHMKNNNLTHDEFIDYTVDMILCSFENKTKK